MTLGLRRSASDAAQLSKPWTARAAASSRSASSEEDDGEDEKEEEEEEGSDADATTTTARHFVFLGLKGADICPGPVTTWRPRRWPRSTWWRGVTRNATEGSVAGMLATARGDE